MEPVLFFILFIGIAIAAAIISNILNQKRRRELEAVAQRLGLSFSPEKDYSMATRFEFLKHLDRGSNRYAYNIISGTFQGHEVIAFEYHYETKSHSSKGGTRTQHHHISACLLLLPGIFPELTIAKEGFFSKIAQAFGYDDIDFESAEFSRAFCVRSPDKRFAYDVCNTGMMEYLLANRELVIEIDRNVLSLAFETTLRPDAFELNLVRLVELRQLMPDYLFTKP
jgi:hypothetical protein